MIDETTALIAAVADRFETRLESLELEIAEAVVAEVPAAAADPAAAVKVRVGMRANLRRLLALVRDHDDRLAPDVPPEALENARELARRGAGVEVAYQVHRVAQRVIWRRWMDDVVDVVGSSRHLISVLDRSLQVHSSYVDHVLSESLAELQRERDALLGGDLARRGEIVRSILAGGLPNDGLLARRLRYDIYGRHTAVILWTADDAEADLGSAALQLGRIVGTQSPLTVDAGTDVLWVWIATDSPIPIADAGIDPALRVAIGSAGGGVSGFRNSHQDAMSVYRLLASNPAASRSATYSEVEVAALFGGDARRVRQFVTSTLGPLAADSPGAQRLRETLRVFLAEADNAPKTARRLHTHRNTVLQRIARATELLGYSPGERRLTVTLALELDRWVRPPEPQSD
ncbi:PucR family transcriptional regulator [Nocardia tengchongensis]|uniref:PucR family transcriptional regulator n=1 Tax=Nocardia tengchongensis TaxID=2055889 RepID=UPI0036C5BA49